MTVEPRGPDQCGEHLTAVTRVSNVQEGALGVESPDVVFDDRIRGQLDGGLVEDVPLPGEEDTVPAQAPEQDPLSAHRADLHADGGPAQEGVGEPVLQFLSIQVEGRACPQGQLAGEDLPQVFATALGGERDECTQRDRLLHGHLVLESPPVDGCCPRGWAESEGSDSLSELRKILVHQTALEANYRSLRSRWGYREPSHSPGEDDTRESSVLSHHQWNMVRG